MTQKLAPIITHWVLVIGINHYSNPKENLRGCVNDANVMKRYLEMSIGTKLNVVSLTATAPSVLPGPPSEEKQSWPTCANIVTNLERIADQAKRGDRVFIYFAGHGAYVPADSTPALVLLCSNGNGKHYFRLNALYKRIEPMIAGGLAVTLVLDCCFSGAIVRGDDQIEIKVRCLDFDPTATISTESTTSSLKDSVTTRDAAMELDWLKYATGLVVLCACAPDERTFEAHLDGRIQGLFTYHLLHALNMLVKNGMSVTHVAVHERLGTSLHAHWSRQTPMRYGKANDVLFGDSLLAPENSSIPVYKDESGELRLRAGEVHGIVKGDEFYASLANTRTAAHRTANVRATVVRAVDSDLEAINGGFGETAIREWKAEPLSSLSPRVVLIGVPPGLFSNMQAIAQETSRYLRLVEKEPASQSQCEGSCSYNVLVNVNDQYEIVDAMLESVFPIPAIQRSSNDDPHQIVRILRHIADFKYFESLENRIPCPKLQASLRIGCNISPGSSNKIDVMHGDKITFSFTNTSDEQLYIGVFDFGSSWQIAAMTIKGFKMLPAKQGDNNGTMRLTMEMEVPEYFQGVRNQYCEDHIKFLITNTATHFHWSLPTIFETIQAPRDSHRGDNDGLHASLAGFLAGFRSHREGKWTTQSFFVRTHVVKAPPYSQ